MDYWLQQRRDAAIEFLQQSGWLRDIQWFDETDSTNTQARQRLASGWNGCPGLLVADRQTAGRGRTTRQWWSPEGCLMFSLVIGQEHVPSDSALWPQLSLVAGVAAATAAEAEVPGIAVKLKWPNDLFVDDRKLAGILVEAVPRSLDGRMAFVIGIGLNVAVDWSGAEPELRRRACSLSQFADRELAIESVLLRMIEHLEVWISSWRSGDQAWWEQWCARSLLTGCTVELRLANAEQLIGVCQGIEPSGRLLVQARGQCHRIQSADVVGWQRGE
ncbi:MAG: biotin--[acetyl-CoA-carboxylase] ligase [Aureliella sp.]